jgi:hypothetical protein
MSSLEKFFIAVGAIFIGVFSIVLVSAYNSESSPDSGTLHGAVKPTVKDAITGQEAAKETSPYIVVRFDIEDAETSISSFEHQLRAYLLGHPTHRIVSLTPMAAPAGRRTGVTTAVVAVFTPQQ